MEPHPFDLESDQWLTERHAAAMNKSAVYNTDTAIWEDAAKFYRARPDGGPTIRSLEGNVWGIPKLGWVARFETRFPFYSRRKRFPGLRQRPQQ